VVFDNGPDPLSLGFFEPFRGEAQPGAQPLFAPDPLLQLVVDFHPSRLCKHQLAGCPGNWTG
jgi:hypothetical protein